MSAALAVESITFFLNLAGAGCWIACFIWMHRVSKRQNAVLGELREMAKRIERLSQEEHDLIKEVEPQVGKIKDKVDDVAEAVKTT